MPFILKRTVTESFSINFDAIPGGDVWERSLNLGGGPLCREAEGFLIDFFIEHDGSINGDKMFSSRADQDSGVEIIWEED